ncbi:hypothetical protein G3I24_27535 [Micromonospora aurantiaca]|nr:hypothetical protein [Micromonospora aurantiaca]
MDRAVIPTGFIARLVDIVDARLRAAEKTTETTGTLVTVSGRYAHVIMDGDPMPLPCKFVGGLTLLPDARVLLRRYGDEWTVTGSFTKDYWPRHTRSLDALTGQTNTTPALGSPEVGFVFIAPPSGAVIVTVGGHITQTSNGNTAYLSWSVRAGDDWTNGTPVHGFDGRFGISAGRAVNSGAAAVGAGSHTSRLLGLEPCAPYVIRTGHWTTPAGGMTVEYRYVQVDGIR